MTITAPRVHSSNWRLLPTSNPPSPTLQLHSPAALSTATFRPRIPLHQQLAPSSSPRLHLRPTSDFFFTVVEPQGHSGHAVVDSISPPPGAALDDFDDALLPLKNDLENAQDTPTILRTSLNHKLPLIHFTKLPPCTARLPHASLKLCWQLHLCVE